MTDAAPGDDADDVGDNDDVADLGAARNGTRVPVVALDTSALMAPVEADVRLFEELDRLLGEYAAVVPDAVAAELDGLREGSGAEATAANVGADLAGRGGRIGTEASYADDGLVELADDGRIDYVVTNDGPLRDRILARDVPVIGLRGRHTLAITEP